MNKIITLLRSFWQEHFQKSLGALLALLAMVDLTGYTHEITVLLGEKGYALLRLIVAGGIVWRAWKARPSP